MEFDKRWAEWLSKRPYVTRYFDPVFVLAQPVAAQGAALAVPGMGQVLASLPVLPSSFVPTAAGIGADLLPNLIAVGTGHEAMAVASALRTHYASPHGGGGTGPAICLASFATNNQLSFW